MEDIDINKMLEDDLDVLLYKLYMDINLTSFGVLPPDFDTCKEEANNWLLSNKEKLVYLICNNKKLRCILSDDSSNRRIEIVTIISDILSSSYIGMPVMTLAVILVK